MKVVLFGLVFFSISTSFLSLKVKSSQTKMAASIPSCGDHENHHNCYHGQTNPSLHQNLDELEFERGIWSAALAGDIEDVANKLNRDNSVVNKTDKSGYTALHYASRSGHLEVCKMLISHGAEVNTQTQSSRATPLQRAAYMGHARVISLLLAHKADPGLIDCDGMTALHKASENGHYETVAVLLKALPSAATVRDKRGRSPMDMAKTIDIRKILEGSATGS